MDPIGYNRHMGFDLKDGLSSSGLKLNYKAKIIPWEKTFITYLIESNKNQAIKKSSKKYGTDKNSPKQKKAGRKL